MQIYTTDYQLDIQIKQRIFVEILIFISTKYDKSISRN